MRRTIQVLATILACTGFFICHAGCGGDDDPGDPGGGTSCDIDITFPAAGTSFLTGENVNLRWDESSGGQVRLSLLKAGVEQGEIAAATGNDGFYRWTASTMGATSGDDFGLAVVHTEEAACGDTLALTLVNTTGCAVTPTYQPTKVTDVDTVQAGDDYLIAWDSENTSGAVDIQFWYFTGAEHDSVTTLVFGTPDDGEYLWEGVDSFNYGTSNNFYVKVADAVVGGCDGRSGYFRIVDPEICEIEVIWPNSTSMHHEGQNMLIQYDGTNDSGAVDLYLYEGMVNLVEYIAQDVSGVGGQYNWTVTIPDGYQGTWSFFRVKVVDAGDPFCFGFSQTFTIRAAP